MLTYKYTYVNIHINYKTFVVMTDDTCQKLEQQGAAGYRLIFFSILVQCDMKRCLTLTNNYTSTGMTTWGYDCSCG